MKNFVRAFLLLALVITGSGALPAADATYYVVYNLTSQELAANAVAQGSPGLFYATNYRTTISVTLQGVAATLASFPNGYDVQSNPGAIAENGLLYSSVQVPATNTGNVFSVGPTVGSQKNYSDQTLSPFLTSSLPNGKLFGLAYGFLDGVYRLSTTDLGGNVTSFYQFSPSDRPGKPIYAADGNFYGVSYLAVSGAPSYFYRVTPAGAFTQIASLPFSGGAFVGSGLLLQASDGNFYGIQQEDGCSSAYQHGTVYRITPSGQFTILHDFGVCADAIVNSLIEGSDGKLYGITQGNSQLFSITTSGVYHKIALTNTFTGLCPCGLIQGSDGRIYGAAGGGGAYGAGVIFAIHAGLPVPKPQPRQFSPASGAVGTQVRIWGYKIGRASVQFSGAAATKVHNAGPNYVWATVPSGATTGPIMVTTPGGTVMTEASFTVQ